MLSKILYQARDMEGLQKITESPRQENHWRLLGKANSVLEVLDNCGNSLLEVLRLASQDLKKAIAKYKDWTYMIF